MIKRVDDVQIIERLNAAAFKNEVSLTYTHKLFFVRLMNLAINEGTLTKSGLEITKSTQQLALALDISPRAVTQSIKKLLSIGAIARIAGEKPFPSCYSYVTIINKEFYEIKED